MTYRLNKVLYLQHNPFKPIINRCKGKLTNYLSIEQFYSKIELFYFLQIPYERNSAKPS